MFNTRRHGALLSIHLQCPPPFSALTLFSVNKQSYALIWIWSFGLNYIWIVGFSQTLDSEMRTACEGKTVH